MDQTTYEVTDVEKQDVPGGYNWIITAMRPNGVQHRFHFPFFVWAARAAEYGIDPKNIELLLDVCLHEVFNEIDHTHPDFVYNNHEEDARAALLSRTAETKQLHLVTDPNNLLQKIKDHHKHTPHIDFHRTHQARVRAFRKVRVSS